MGSETSLIKNLEIKKSYFMHLNIKITDFYSIKLHKVDEQINKNSTNLKFFSYEESILYFIEC